MILAPGAEDLQVSLQCPDTVRAHSSPSNIEKLCVDNELRVGCVGNELFHGLALCAETPDLATALAIIAIIANSKGSPAMHRRNPTISMLSSPEGWATSSVVCNNLQ